VLTDALLSIGALGVLLVTLISVDERVRQRVAGLLTSTPDSSDLVDAGAQLHDISAVLLAAARDQSIEHAPLLVFAAAAIVLVLCMVRT
jgi:hypothetical protein